MEEEYGVSDQSLAIAGSGSKVFVGEKRPCAEVEERSELYHKRVKMRDLESVLRSEGRTELHTRLLDQNTNIAASSNATALQVDETNRLSSVGKKNNGHTVKSKGLALDLNAEDVSSSINHNPLYPCKNSAQFKSKDYSECASSVGPLDENDSMRIWNEMKQNGFLSHSHGGVPVPKPQGKKSKNDGMKKKLELAKKERVDRFAKVAAPSGLLNGLNPGIINHVRNSKQVHSIIEALVRSEKHESAHGESKYGNQTKAGMKDLSGRKEDDNINCPIASKFNLGHGDLLGSRYMSGFPASLNKSISLNSELTGGYEDSSMIDTRVTGKMVYHPNHNTDAEDDALALKLSSSTTIASDNTSSLSNEESANPTSVTSLSIKAANIASQWLELLHQDIKGRLAALRRSKKRVRAVIHTEFPCLLSREFSSNQEDNSYSTQSSSVGHSGNATANAHGARWTALFNQMDASLSDEERQLETWLIQVKQMQLQCEHGLQKFGAPYDLHRMGILQNDCRLGKSESAERDLAVKAAAASIYSTCDHLSSMEKSTCC